MEYERKVQLARTGDISGEALSARLVAARKAAGFKEQKSLSKQLGIAPQTYNSQEVRGAPSIKTMAYLYRNHRIDFNFIIHGDFAQLPGDVQERLFAALDDGEPSQDRTPS